MQKYEVTVTYEMNIPLKVGEYSVLKNLNCQTGKMALRLKVLASKTNSLSLIPSTHSRRKKLTPICCPLRDRQTHTQINKMNLKP